MQLSPRFTAVSTLATERDFFGTITGCSELFSLREYEGVESAEIPAQTGSMEALTRARLDEWLHRESRLAPTEQRAGLAWRAWEPGRKLALSLGCHGGSYRNRSFLFELRDIGRDASDTRSHYSKRAGPRRTTTPSVRRRSIPEAPIELP